MPIVIDRATGTVKSAPELTAAQKDTIWSELVRSYISKHPELFEEEDQS